MTLNHQRLLHHIERIYDASLTPSLWADVLQLLCHDLKASCGVLHIRDKKSLAPLIFSDAGVDPDGIAVYAGYFYLRDLWAQKFSQTREGDVLFGTQLVATEEMEKSEFLNDFLLGYAGPHALISIPVKSARIESNFTLIKSVHQEPFESDALNHMRHLIPHISRAIHVSLKLGS